VEQHGATLPEKAVLMSALLEAAGIEADPVAVTREAFFDEKLGTLPILRILQYGLN